MTRPRIHFEVGREYVLNDGRIAKLIAIRDTGHHPINAKTLKPRAATSKLLILKIRYGGRLVLHEDGSQGCGKHPESVACALGSRRKRAA